VPASVSKTCLVRFDNNRYSVAARAVGRPVEIRAYGDPFGRELIPQSCGAGRNEPAPLSDDSRGRP
jgi:hypothetical protein